jgi:hypothetical protein
MEDLATRIHVLICEDSLEDCQTYGGPCQEAAVAAEQSKAELWAEGEAAGWSRAMRYMSDEPTVQRAKNPYSREEKIDISSDDILVHYFRSSTDKPQHNGSVVRITHKPTGIVTESSTEKSRLANSAKALEELQERLKELE